VCSLEVPDITQSLAAAYDPDELAVLLVNPVDDQYTAADFLTQADVTLPCLLDEEGLYGGYPRPGAYGPYPLHVLIDADGVIRYLSSQYDPQAAHEAISAAL
jgi:peroxiredoxin